MKANFMSILVTFLAPIIPAEALSPCIPPPCGPNAICKEQNGAASCQCLIDYFGNPYEGCHPECTLSSDCMSNMACMRMKCQNPCPGTCGQNAECQVINHLPSCSCPSGFTGDPFTYCRPYQAPTRKSLENVLPDHQTSTTTYHSLISLPADKTTHNTDYYAQAYYQ
jgi:hypothetical protein